RGEIALCERPDAFGFERLDRREERRLVLVSAGELACDLRHVGQLDRALDLRVTRENLLEQGRARARQADDEDRIARRRTRTSPSLEELPGKEMPAVLDEALILTRTVGMLLPMDGIALGIVTKRRLVHLLVLERLAERELEVQSIRGGEIGPRERAAHCRDVLG